MSKFIEFRDILEMCQSEALADKLVPTDEAIHRYFCRQYSKTFHTALDIALKMDPAIVVKAVYEDRLDQEDELEHVEKYLDTIYSLLDPEYERQKDQDNEDFLMQAEEEEAERVRQGKPIHPSLKNDTTLPSADTGSKFPKSGGIDLSYLEKEEQ